MSGPTSSAGGPPEPRRDLASWVARSSSSDFLRSVAVDTPRLYDHTRGGPPPLYPPTVAGFGVSGKDVPMKRVSVELRYPGRTVEEVRAMLADPAFRQAVCDYQAVEDSEVVVEEYDDGSMTVDTHRTYGADFVPSFARK